MTASPVAASRLWGLCDILRDDGITYHQYINELSYLLFLKLATETGTEHSLPSHCTWTYLTSLQGEEEQFKAYKRLLVDLGNLDDALIGAIFANPTSLIRRSRTLRMLVSGISELEWHDTEKESFGDFYEELLGYAAEKRSGAGQYFTPRPLIETMVELMQPRPGEVIQDPALGTAGFLVAAHQYICREIGSAASGRYVGVELVPDNFRLALMNTFVHRMKGEFYLEDTLSDCGASLPKADIVLTNPPFGTSRGAGPPQRTDLPIPTSNKQIAFLQHIIGTLRPGGRAAVVLPDNVLFEGGAGKAVRTQLLEKCNLHTLLRLPSGIFYAQGVKTNVLFFTRGHRDSGNTSSLWVYDLRTGIAQFGLRTPLTRDAFQAFEAVFGADPDGGAAALRARVDEGPSGRFRAFSRDALAERGDNLDLFWLREEEAELQGWTAPELLHEAAAELAVVIDDLRALLTDLAPSAERD